MDRPDTKSVIIQSGSNFYKEITKKYQTGKIRNLTFPRMIFCKNVKYLLPQAVNVNVYLQLHLNSQSNVLSLVKSLVPKTIVIENESGKIIKPLLLTLNRVLNSSTNKTISSSSVRVNTQISNHGNHMKLLNSQMFRGELNYGLLSSNVIVNPQISNHGNYMKLINSQMFREELNYGLLSSNVIVNTQTLNHGNHMKLINSQMFRGELNYGLLSSSVKVNTQISNHGNYMKLLNSQMFRGRLNYGLSNTVKHTIYLDKNIDKYQYKQPSITSKYNLFFNRTIDGINKLFFKDLEQVTVNQHLSKNYHGTSKNFESSFAQRVYSYKTDNESLHFQNSRRLESEIEQIKKIVIQTKESLSEKIPPALGEADIKKHLDINRISDQVYQNLERKIRMERERRGI